jgi:ribose 5-phosphate isomerase B
VRIAVGVDHAGFPLKQGTIEVVRELGHSAEDLGTDSTDPVDYPDFARAVAVAVASGRCDRGIVICGSGVGASVAATKVPGIRAAMCHDTFSARQGVEDDDMNVISLGARVIGPALAAEIIKAFANARFSEAERHVRRLRKVNAIEEEARNGAFDEARRLR